MYSSENRTLRLSSGPLDQHSLPGLDYQTPDYVRLRQPKPVLSPPRRVFAQALLTTKVKAFPIDANVIVSDDSREENSFI
jgi:hypothetical protein